MKALSYVLAFIGGAAVGVTAGMLCAPQSGDELRSKITEALRKRGIKLSKLEMTDLVDEIAEQFEKKQEEEAAAE